MKTIIIGDIHGCGKTLEDFIADQKLISQPVDRIIFLGDYIDRGLNSRRVMLCLRSLKVIYRENLILLRGNHELMAHEFLRTEDDSDFYVWNNNGAQTTFDSYEINDKMWDLREDMNWLFMNSQWTYENEKEGLYCAHACFTSLTDAENRVFPTYKSKPHEYDFYKNLVWDRECDHFGIKDSCFFHGHTPIAVEDCCTGKYHNCINLDNGLFLGRALRYAIFTDAQHYSIKHFFANEQDIDEIWKSWKGEI